MTGNGRMKPCPGSARSKKAACAGGNSSASATTRHPERSPLARKLGGRRPPGFPDGRALHGARASVPVPCRRAEGPTKEVSAVRKVIEYVLVSADGAFEDPVGMGVGAHQD